MATLLENQLQPARGSLSGDPKKDSTDANRAQGAARYLEPFTRVAARIELGKDNALFIRGQGEGLRWDRGQPLARLGRGIWVWAARRATEPIEFHLLLDDQIWARGDNFVLEPGRAVELQPDFEWPEIPQAAPPSKS